MIKDATQASSARSATYSTHLLATWQHSRPCCPLIILHCCLGYQVNICRVMHDFDEGPPNNLPPPPPIPGIKEYKRKYEECKKPSSILGSRKACVHFSRHFSSCSALNLNLDKSASFPFSSLAHHHLLLLGGLSALLAASVLVFATVVVLRRLHSYSLKGWWVELWQFLRVSSHQQITS